MFLATDLKEGEPTPDTGEFIETFKYNIEDLIKMVDRGEIIDSKTIIGISFAKKYLDKKQ